MTGAAEVKTRLGPLSGESVFVVGRLYGVTRRRLTHLVGLQGGKLAAKPGPRVTVVVPAHSAAGRIVLPDGALTLPAGLPSVPTTSEGTFRRLLGLAPALD